MAENNDILVRPVRPEDRDGWAALRRDLFPDFDPPEIDEFFTHGGFPSFQESAVFVAETADGDLAGFVEATARPYAEGCATTPVAYLEGWYVDKKWRRHRVGAVLVAAVQDWARALGMTEIASDAAPENDVSRKAHKALGFKEVEQIVCFSKKL